MKRIGIKMWKALIALIEVIIRRVQYKSRIEDKMDFLIEETKQNTLGLLRLRYLYFIEHRPTEVSIICVIYDEYKKRGGNSEIDAIHAEWKKNLRKGIYKTPTKRKKK